MKQVTSTTGLATIFPAVGEGEALVLSARWKWFVNVALMAMPLAMSLLLLPLIAVSLWLGPTTFQRGPAQPFWYLLAGAVGVLVAQSLWAGSYPEWPTNRLLLFRLRRRCLARLSSDNGGSRKLVRKPERLWISKARMVEWVPRENWSTTRLDSAEDVMLLHVDDSGITMMGDRNEYFFPSASLIAAEIESIRPTGCFHWLHFVVLVVRTSQGPMEFPLAYRDHALGRLRSRHRHASAVALAGHVQQLIESADDFVLGEGDCSWDQRHEGHRSELRGPAGRRGVRAEDEPVNPYATPRTL